jgi:uncharacterized protein
MTTRENINDFLSQRRIAVVGVSRNPKEFSRTLFAQFRARGFDVVPVNPHVAEIEGTPCYKRVQDIQPPVAGALLLTASQVTEQVVRDCAEAGIKRVWIRGEGVGSVSPQAVAFCEQNGIVVVPGQCPFMFLPDTAIFHRMHGFVMKLTGAYPK